MTTTYEQLLFTELLLSNSRSYSCLVSGCGLALGVYESQYKRAVRSIQHILRGSSFGNILWIDL
jgi:hypothetical protein